MSPTGFQELVTFIGRRFDAVDRRFDALHAHIDERFREATVSSTRCIGVWSASSRNTTRSRNHSGASRPSLPTSALGAMRSIAT
jgi:hypothetical protein